jgi:hypothetical protein
MPPQSRAQRRRQSQRSGARPPQPVRAPSAEQAELTEAPDAPALAATGPTTPLRSQRQVRRSTVRVPEPVDYTQDYAFARHDLIRIVIISVVLFAVMVALGFSGLI